MFKNLLCIFLTVIIAVPSLVLGAAAADPQMTENSVEIQVDSSVANATVTVSSCSGRIGEQVKVDVVMQYNSGIAAFRFYIDFDNTALEPVALEKGNAVTAGNIYSNVSSTDISVLVTTWDNAYDVAMNGVVFSVTFEVKKTSGLGDYPLTLSYNQVDVCNENFEDVYFQVINGNVNVNGFSIYSDDVPEIEIGETLQVLLDLHNANPLKNEIVWTSGNTDIASVDENGCVTGVGAGKAVISASTQDGKYSESYDVIVWGLISDEQSSCVVNRNENYIYGIAPGLKTLDAFVESADSSCELILEPVYDCIGTGTKATLVREEEVIESYTVVVFGDANCDGWYDGEDAFLVNLIVNGLLDKEDVGEAVWTASDCNHDGIIDEADVELLSGAGLKLNDVDQTEIQAELVTDSAYFEYAMLIDQSAGMATGYVSAPNSDEIVESEDNTTESENSTEKFVNSAEETDVEAIYVNIFEFIKKIFTLIFSFIIK